MRLSRLLSELKRRRVYQVAAAYAVAGFAVLEAADLVLPALPAPAWTYRALVILVLVGFPVVVVLAWVFDITPEGVERDRGPDEDDDGEPALATIRLPAARQLMVITVVAAVVGIGAWLAGRRTSSAPGLDPRAHLAVLPFAPAVPDSGLERIGRELVVTVSSALAGTGELTTVEPLAVLARVPEGGRATLRDAREAAAALGAEHLLHGGLVRSNDGIRMEIALYETGDLRPLGTETTTASDVHALTDSAAVAALRLLWTDADAAPPSPGALATGSLDALQAYLEGERAIAAGRWREAPEHFARAVAADSGFWYAYWRLQYALRYHGSPVDSVVRARVWEHRHDLPDRDRLLIEATAAPLPESIALLEETTERFPTFWPAWWQLAERYIHDGGYLGYTLADSRTALERTLTLNPRFVSAWSHLFWIGRAVRDTATMRRVLEELSAAHYDRVTLQEAGINTLEFYRAQLAIAEGPGVPDRVIETGVTELSSYRGPQPPENLASSLTVAGFLAAQIELSRAILQRGAATPPMERAQHLARAYAWAGRGGWDSALVAIDAYAAAASDPEDLLHPYRLAVVGVWEGALPVTAARERRPGAGSSPEVEAAMRAEIAWLDGLIAAAVGDPAGLARARDALTDGTDWAPLLDRSLAALALAVDGDTLGAARALSALELESAEQGLHADYGPDHPFLNGVHRLTAARWLMAHDDPITARRLLSWHEVVLPGRLYRLMLANQVMTAPALRIRWQLARAAGQSRQAALYERLFRERWAEPGLRDPPT